MPFRVQKDRQGAWKLVSLEPQAAACVSCRRCAPRELPLSPFLLEESCQDGAEGELILSSRQIVLILGLAFILPASAGLGLMLLAGVGGLGEVEALALGLVGIASGWGLAAAVSRRWPQWFRPRWIVLGQGGEP